MTTPTKEIARLDRELARKGQTISVRRGTGAAHTCTGFVRGYAIEKVVGLVTLADRRVIVSPAGLGTYGIPRNGDDFATDGKLGKVQEVEPFHMNDVLIRVEMRVRLA